MVGCSAWAWDLPAANKQFMDIIWNISTQDKKKITSFVEKYRNDPFVQQRLERNLGDSVKDLSEETVWFALVSCLATSQQRSGPNSPVVNFINSVPFALHYQSCISSSDLETFAKEVISEYGLRFHNRLSDYIAPNLNFAVCLLSGHTHPIIQSNS